MVWLEFVGDHLPGTLAGIGAWAVIGVAIGAVLGLILPGTRRGQKREGDGKADLSAEDEAREDAAVAALERYILLSAHLAGIFCELQFGVRRGGFKAGGEPFSRYFQGFVAESS